MPKTARTFLCSSCGATHARWVGKCPDCGTWDALQEYRVDAAAASDPQRGAAGGWTGEHDAAIARPLSQIESLPAAPRLATGIGELDRVLGGGLVPGSAVLFGGAPGIGKSTLLLQAADALASRGVRTLYVSSEESAEQVRLRAARLATPAPAFIVESKPVAPKGTPRSDAPSLDAAADNLFVLSDTNLARIVEQARKVSPRVIVIDSVQMIYKADLDAAPGSITQLRRCASELVYLAKISGMAVVLVGHVTKEGTLAGPRLLEHLVDAVLQFEGDRYHAHRIVRGVKNRFGTTLEIGIFRMTGRGLEEVPEGAGVAAAHAGADAAPGSVVCPVMTGTRCVLVEIQALTATGFLGAAKRKSSGLDANRLAMIIAVLEQHGGLRLADRDIFCQALGGVRIVEPAADLPLLLAIAGAHYRRALEPTTAAVGEVGLGGEVRAVAQLEHRLAEAARLGFTRVIVPMTRPPVKAPKGVQLAPVRTVQQAIELLG